jgi:hexulose-6-phosphate isomerase
MILKSINYWSAPGGMAGTLPIHDFLASAKRHGYDAVELCVAETAILNLDAGQEFCVEIRQMAEAAGIGIPSIASGIYWSYAVASESDADRKRAIEALKSLIRITSWIGAKTLLVIPGAVDIFFQPGRQPSSYDDVWDRSIAGLREALPIAEGLGVVMAIENVWNKFLLSPLEMRQFIDSFSSRSIGAYVDVANVLPFGYPEQWIRILGKERVAGIHFKDFRTGVGTADGFVDLLSGDVNWPEVMTAIAEIGYSGPIVAEMIPLYKHHPKVRLATTSLAMNAILGRS